MPAPTRPRRPRASPPASLSARDAVRQVAETAWTGQHAQAIALATGTLADGRITIGERIDLLDLRCDSVLATGDAVAATAEAVRLTEAAARTRDPARRAQAGNRTAIVQIRAGRSDQALVTAEAALRDARAAGDAILEATAQLRLADACMRTLDNARGIAAAHEAIRLFRAARRPVGMGRALWALSSISSTLGRVEAAQRAGREALAIARRCGDRYGIGDAANILAFDEPDIAVAFAHVKEASRAFTAAGYLERLSVVTHNLGNGFSRLGLYRRASRHLTQASADYRGFGSGGQAARTSWLLAEVAEALGDLPAARRHIARAIDEVDAVGGRGYVAPRQRFQGWLALVEGDIAAAVPQLRAAADIAHSGQTAPDEIDILGMLTRALLASGDTAAALEASTRATRLHIARGLVAMEGIDPPDLWWWHSRALDACGHAQQARAALDRAYRFLVRRFGSLSDEGLRRNALNKPPRLREVVLAWLDAHARRFAAGARVPPHLAGQSARNTNNYSYDPELPDM